jgi:hypothetical protein
VLADEYKSLEEWREMTVTLNGFSTAYVEASAQKKTRILWVPTMQLVKFVRETEGNTSRRTSMPLGSGTKPNTWTFQLRLRSSVARWTQFQMRY